MISIITILQKILILGKVNNLSLSKFIDFPDVKAKLRQEFVKPRFSVNKPLLAPLITMNPPKIGTAFDYLLRFCANYLNPKAITGKWTAEESLKILELSRDNDTIIIDAKNRIVQVQNADLIPRDYVKKCKKLKQKHYSEAKKVIETAKENLDSYLRTGEMNNDLIKSSLALAQLDVLKRAMYLSNSKSFIAERNDVEDLRHLISIAKPDIFKATQVCVLNPNFGPEAIKLMNADGDIVIDDTLIDIKTVKRLNVKREFFNQLIGYYTLYRIGGIKGMSPEHKINKLGIYFSRHGYLHTYKIDDIIDEKIYLDFIEWFKKRASNFKAS